LNSRERVWRSFDLEEPDRVPIAELGIDIPHIEAIMGRKFDRGAVGTSSLEGESREEELTRLKVECYRKLEFDMIVGSISPPKDWRPKANPDGTIVDEWGRVLYHDMKCEEWIPGTRTLFQTPEEWKNYALPDAQAPGRCDGLERMKRLIAGEMLLAGNIRDPFALLWEMFAPINFVKWMYQSLPFIKRMFENVTAYNIGAIGLISDTGVELIISTGDWCEKMGPMVPSKFFKETIFPNLRRQVNVAHSRGLKFIKHTDGNIAPLLKDLSDIVDGLHSLDPSAGVDIGDVKSKYGDRLVLLGNVSVDNLARRSSREIADETKECIRKASASGGHVLSSSNSWFTDARLENCLTMVEVGKKFGMYPSSF